MVSVLAAALLGCATRDDDYLLVRRVVPRPAGDLTRLRYADADDAAALRVRRLLADGFGAELLRTVAMVKRYVRRTSDAPAAHEPTLVALGPSDVHREGLMPSAPLLPYRGRVIEAGWFRRPLPPDAPLVWADSDSEVAPPPGARSSDADRNAATFEALVDGLGCEIVDLVSPSSTSLREGYLAFLEVVAAEWRPPPSADGPPRAFRDKAVFADVRANNVTLAAAPELLVEDPILIATLLHRMASSELGRRMARDETYLPFLADRPPPGVRAALLLGAFRNFQAKLLGAWHQAVNVGRPPGNAIDLLEAYAEAYPEERPEATRIFIVTTFGATVVRGGVRNEPEGELADRLSRLTADVVFGRRSLRDALSAGSPSSDGRGPQTRLRL